MQVASHQLSGQLSQGLRSLYTFHGDEPLQQQEGADAIRAAARAPGVAERQVFTVAGRFDWSEVLAAGGAMNLFSERQLIELRIPSGKPGKEGSPVLQQIAENAAQDDSTVTLVFLPRLDKATKSTAWFSALEQNGVTIATDVIERTALPHWLAQRLQAHGQRVAAGDEGQRTLQFFADRVEGNLLAAHQEVQKLALLYPPGELSFEQVEQAVLDVARYDVFKLSPAVLGGQLLRVQRMLDGLRAEGVAEVLVHYTLSEDIRALRRVKEAVLAGRPLPMVLREQRSWGDKERLYERLIPHLHGVQLSRLLQEAHWVDGIVKGLKRPDWPADPWQALHRLATRLGRLCALALKKGQ